MKKTNFGYISKKQIGKTLQMQGIVYMIILEKKTLASDTVYVVHGIGHLRHLKIFYLKMKKRWFLL